MPSHDAEGLMRLAIDKAAAGIAAGQTPFGCAIAMGADVVAVEHNTVWQTTDITAHAEINALRAACRTSQQVHLSGAVVATTCEPCPMCLAALHWARVDRIYYGASIADAKSAGFNELAIHAADMLRLGHDPIKLVPNVLADECRELFVKWRASGKAREY